jgi:hypothetical protein
MISQIDEQEKAMNSHHRLRHYRQQDLVATNLESILTAEEYAKQRSDRDFDGLPFGLYGLQ